MCTLNTLGNGLIFEANSSLNCTAVLLKPRAPMMV